MIVLYIGTYKMAEKEMNRSPDQALSKKALSGIALSGIALPKHVWVLFFSLYTTQYVGIGFLTIVLVLILRKNGMSLDKLSLIPLMSMPVAVKVLWAPVIDKYLKTDKNHYRNWLLIAQFFMLVSLLMLAFVNPIQQFSLTLGIVFIFSLMTATQDLALSGLICQVFAEYERQFISAIKTSGAMLGNIIGGGVVLLLYPYAGWKWCILLLCVILAYTWGQLWFFREWQYRRVNFFATDGHKNYWRNLFLIWKGHYAWLVLLIIIPFGILPSYNLMSPVLVDNGWSLPDIAILLKLFGSAISLVAILLISKLTKKLTRKQSLSLAILFHACCLLSFIPVSLGYVNVVAVYFSFFLYFISLPFVFISISVIIMDNVADSSAPATVYNVQTAIGFIFGFLVVSLSYYLAQQFGYFVVTIGSILIAFFAAFFAARAV